MIYKDFKGLSLSALGLGTMRLPVVDGDNGRIDKEATADMVNAAIKSGINYFDTAWGYHNGQSEPVIGEILSRYPRDSYYIATKFPGYDLANMDKVETIFPQQLERCRVDCIDFYLIHNVCEKNIDAYLDPKYGILPYLRKQKQEGRIRHFGFSVHGNAETMNRFLDVYGDDMEFCQIQLNYLDLTFQKADEKLSILKERGIPVWVMEPLRGGKLAAIADEYANALAEIRPDETVPGWAFRFLQSIPEVTVTLSGMSNMQQLVENIRTFEEDKPLDQTEMAVLLDVAASMANKASLPCTACRYCTEYCPQGIDIPTMIEMYNEHTMSGGGFLAPMRISSLPEDKRPQACIGCRSCEAVCPQQIKIADMMTDFSEKLKA